MGLEVAPEIKMARKLHGKHSLTIPVNLNELVKKYAQVIYKTIPIEGIDGVCLNLKNPKKSTKVVVNNSSSSNRQRFTLAHELGHIIIPWHLGTIIDDIDNPGNKNVSDKEYWNHEKEANKFASELLMPFDWLYSRFLENQNLSDLVKSTSFKCLVSEEAARIRVDRFWREVIEYLLPASTIQEEYAKTQRIDRVQQILVKNSPFHPIYVAQQIVESIDRKIAFCVEENDKVIGCGSTKGTHHYYQAEDSIFNPTPYPSFKSYHVFDFYDVKTHWWDLEVDFNFTDDERSWRELLDQIANDLVPSQEIRTFKSRLNGVIAGTHGSWKKKYPQRDVEEFIIEIISRFNNNNDAHIFNHPDFASFVRTRCLMLFDKAV